MALTALRTVNATWWVYAYVNLITPAIADKTQKYFQGFNNWTVNNSKACEVCWTPYPDSE